MLLWFFDAQKSPESCQGSRAEHRSPPPPGPLQPKSDFISQPCPAIQPQPTELCKIKSFRKAKLKNPSPKLGVALGRLPNLGLLPDLCLCHPLPHPKAAENSIPTENQELPSICSSFFIRNPLKIPALRSRSRAHSCRTPHPVLQEPDPWALLSFQLFPSPFSFSVFPLRVSRGGLEALSRWDGFINSPLINTQRRGGNPASPSLAPSRLFQPSVQN